MRCCRHLALEGDGSWQGLKSRVLLPLSDPNLCQHAVAMEFPDGPDAWSLPSAQSERLAGLELLPGLLDLVRVALPSGTSCRLQRNGLRGGGLLIGAHKLGSPMHTELRKVGDTSRFAG